MGKAWEQCKLPCLMDSRIQLSIQKFQIFKWDQIEWFSPREAHKHFHSSVGIIIYVCWIWWSKCLSEQRRTCIHHPLWQTGTDSPPHSRNSADTHPSGLHIVLISTETLITKRTSRHPHLALNVLQWPSLSGFEMYRRKTNPLDCFPLPGTVAAQEEVEVQCLCHATTSHACRATAELRSPKVMLIFLLQ